ncbi:hypothetical protein HFO91_34945, partial [Rhizobium leguminosarum]
MSESTAPPSTLGAAPVVTDHQASSQKRRTLFRALLCSSSHFWRKPSHKAGQWPNLHLVVAIVLPAIGSAQAVLAIYESFGFIHHAFLDGIMSIGRNVHSLLIDLRRHLFTLRGDVLRLIA